MLKDSNKKILKYFLEQVMRQEQMELKEEPATYRDRDKMVTNTPRLRKMIGTVQPQALN